MTIQSDLQAAVSKATAASQKLHEVVHGDAASTVATENGPVKTVAKTIADNEAEIAASRGELDQKVADAAASAAAAAADADRAEQAANTIVIPLPVVSGGTGADTPAGARANLELGALATKSTVAEADLDDGAVTGPKIAVGAVGEPQLAAASVNESKLAAGAVTPPKLAGGSADPGPNTLYGTDAAGNPGFKAETVSEILLDLDAEVHQTGYVYCPFLVGVEKGSGKIVIGVVGGVVNALSYFGVEYEANSWDHFIDASNIGYPVAFVKLLRPKNKPHMTEPELGRVVKLSAYYRGWYALTANGYVLGGGAGANRQFGDGSTYDRPGPWLIEGPTLGLLTGLAPNQRAAKLVTTIEMAAHDAMDAPTAYVLRQDGRVVTIGYDGYGQRALGTSGASDVDAKLAKKTGNVDLTGVVDLWAFGGNYGAALVLCNDGTWWVVGYNGYGQLGLGDTTARQLFTQVTALPDPATKGGIKKIAAVGGASAFAILILFNNGELWGAGYNGYGQLGDGTTLNVTTFKKLSGADVVVDVWNAGSEWSAYGATYIKLADGTCKFAGYNGYGLGLEGSVSNQNTFQVMTDFPLLGRPAVPEMTSGPYADTCKVSASGTPTTWHPWKAFQYGYFQNRDGQQARACGWEVATTTNVWLEVDFDPNGIGDAAHKRTINRYAIRQSGAFDGTLARYPKNFRLQGWDGAAWTDLDVRTNIVWANANTTKHFAFANAVALSKYRLYVDANNGDATYTCLAKLFLFESTEPQDPIAEVFQAGPHHSNYPANIIKTESGRYFAVGYQYRGAQGIGQDQTMANTGYWPIETVFPVENDRIRKIFGRINIDAGRTWAILDDGRVLYSGASTGYKFQVGNKVIGSAGPKQFIPLTLI